jgi:hypothetical protein
MKIQCNNCISSWPDDYLERWLAEKFTGVIRSRITYGCIARLITSVKHNRLVVGVEAGTSDGATLCVSNKFGDIVSRIAILSAELHHSQKRRESRVEVWNVVNEKHYQSCNNSTSQRQQ